MTRTGAEFWRDLVESVFLEKHARKLTKLQAAEARLPPEPEPVAPPPPIDPLSVLDAHIAGIDREHAEAEAKARREYVAVLVAFSPPRAGPAPPPEAHALAAPSTVSVPPPGQILAVLDAVGKSRDDLREDVKLLTVLRDKADLAAQGDAREAEEKAAKEAVEEAICAFDELEAEWDAKVRRLKRRAAHAETLASATRSARTELEELQGVSEELRALKSPTINDRARATPAELVAEAEAKKAQQAAREKAARLGAIESAFFPSSAP